VKRLLVFLVVRPFIFNAMGLFLFGEPELESNGWSRLSSAFRSRY
jgi:hypothetical protein